MDNVVLPDLGSRLVWEVQMAGYRELTQPDRRTLHFTPLGLASGTLDPNDAVAFQSAVIADAVLADAVPEEIRSTFERLRDKHVRGVIDYGNFAEICNQALTLYEPALRTRFVQYYQGREIPFAERDETPAPLRTDRYDAVYGCTVGWVQCSAARNACP